MSNYQSEINVKSPANEVFQFVCEPRNMPQYLPTVHRAQPEEERRVTVDGDAGGHPYHADGWFDVDRTARTMKWGSDGETQYRGELRVEEAGEGSRIHAQLDFEPTPNQDAEFERRMNGRDQAIQEGLDKSLQSIRNICEGHGGKVPTSADSESGYLA